MSAETKQPATRRILNAARDLVQRGGAAEISMGDVATRAGVSKALVHYHFRDKTSLLVALAEDVGFAVVQRARDALERPTGSRVLDDQWAWLDTELRLGDIRILISLAEYDNDRVRAASRRMRERRRELAIDHVVAVYSLLELSPRIPAPLLADTVLAFIDGLAVAHATDQDRDPRPAFDALWLALLSLAE